MFILEYNNKNCMVDSKENYKSGLGVKGLKINTWWVERLPNILKINDKDNAE